MSAVSIPSRKMPWQTKAQRGTVLAALAIKREIVKARLLQIREDVGHPDKPGKPLTVEDAAAKAGVKYRTWQRWEAGESVPYASNLAAVADAFGFDVREFYDDSGDKAPTPDPFPPAVEADLSDILSDIKAQLAEQTQVLNDVKQLLLDVQNATATQAAAAVQMQAATDLLNTLQPLEPVQEPAESQPKAD